MGSDFMHDLRTSRRNPGIFCTKLALILGYGDELLRPVNGRMEDFEREGFEREGLE
jgi:hypothetical protein